MKKTNSLTHVNLQVISFLHLLQLSLLQWRANHMLITAAVLSESPTTELHALPGD